MREVDEWKGYIFGGSRLGHVVLFNFQQIGAVVLLNV